MNSAPLKSILFPALIMCAVSGPLGPLRPLSPLTAQTLQTQTTPDQTNLTPQPTSVSADPVVTARDGNQKVWSRITSETNLATGEITATTNTAFIELATGSGHLVNGAWVDSSDQIQITADGALGTNSQHQVTFQGNINSQGAVVVTLPEGNNHLTATVLGLSYLDQSSGKSVLIAELKDSQGLLLPSGNQVLYPDCFTDLEANAVKADLLYINSIQGVEQLVVIRKQLPAPSEWGLSDDTTVLQVITAFDGAPQPQITQRTLGGDVDQHLDFGVIQMGRGVAFAFGSETNTIPVTKQWLLLSGRQCLVEQTPFMKLEPLLEQLAPASTNHAGLKSSPDGIIHRVAGVHLLPERNFARNTPTPVKLASTERGSKGVAMDWSMAVSQANMRFQCDTTYYVSTNVTLSGSTIFEGGTCIKFTNNAGITLSSGTMTSTGSRYRMVVLTSKDDSSVGDAIPGATGSPTNTTATFLNNQGTGAYKFMRFSYAGTAIQGDPEDAAGGVWHCQFFHCTTGITSVNAPYGLHNVLLSQCTYPLYINYNGASVHGEHVTVDQATTLWNVPQNDSLALTNSILTSVTNIGTTNVSLVNCTTNSSAAGIFQTVGAASYYLVSGSTNRNAGSTNINPSLAADLSKMTTYPPVAIVSNYINVNTNFNPQAQRDTDVPDLGYHYDPLDWVFSGVVVTNATISLSNGVAIGVYGPFGIQIGTNGTILSTGSATNPNRIAHYNTVQERSTTNWTDSSCWSVTFQTNAPCKFYFTDWSIFSQDGYPILDNDAPIAAFTNAYPLTFWANTFHGGKILELQIPINVTNCLFERVNLQLSNAKHSALAANFINDLFFGGQLSCSTHTSCTNNLFDRTTVISGGTGDYNGYITNFSRLSPNGAHDQILTNIPVYQTSYLGSYYYPTNDGMLSTLIDSGSCYATNEALFHYCTTTNQLKEAGSIVDIGFHYVACDANGNPDDTNTNGIPDYLEDTTGTGGFIITLSSPPNNSFYLQPATVPIQASVIDWSGQVTNVEFLRATTAITDLPSSPYLYSWPSVPAGAYSLMGVAYDFTGVRATSAPITLTITNLCGTY